MAWSPPPLWGRARVGGILAILTLLACTPAHPEPGSGGAQAPAVESRTLVLVGRQEPSTLSGTLLLALGIGANATRRPFNAALAMMDGEEKPVAYLAESLPQLHTDSWRVSPDGRMETTYRLRPNLTWHDGAPLTAADFLFAWQVYRTPDFGTATSPPHTLMDEVVAQDSRTLVIRWRGLFAGAGALQGLGGAGASPSFGPLPRHLLEEQYQ
jgi:ABC-type transport system substrate-binding protein